MSACRASQISIVIAIIAIAAHSAHAIGWDSDDFLIGGGPSFTTKIGVFDHDLTFKGYLDSNFVTVEGMDFDAAGHLVAVASGNVRSVRVYDSSGAQVGGFTRSDNLLGTAVDLKVAPDGSYVIGTQNFGGGDGARQFSPDGTFLRQYGTGNISGVAVVPGNRVWISGAGQGIVVFDLATGASVGSIAIPGVQTPYSMSYSVVTNTVLVVDIPSGAAFETNLSGAFIRRFNSPAWSSGLLFATRGPTGDVFATTGSDQSVLRWHADGTYVGATAMPTGFGVAGLVWAGNVPEPGIAVPGAIAVCVLRRRALRDGRVRQN